MKDLTSSIILGAATGYTPDKVEVFLESLSVAKYEGKVVLFINDNQYEDYNLYFLKKDYSFKLEFSLSRIGILSSTKKIGKNLKKLIKILSGIIVNLEPALKKDFIYFLGLPHVSRFFDYYNYLLLKSTNEDIMLTDTRDVIVQRNPFDNNLNGLYLGMEHSRILIGQDDFHIKWISDVYGKQYLNKIGSEKICCAGVTLGDHKSVMLYLKTMIDEFMSLPYYKMVRSNYDQGIHNKLLYSNNFEDVVHCDPLKSIISTVGLVPRNEIILNCNNEILDLDGRVSTIIHQYDRHKDIENIFIKKYLN